MKKFLSALLASVIVFGCVMSVPASADTIKKGDIYNDENINSRDALLVLKYSVGLTYFSGKRQTAADVDMDGKVNAKDALLILMYAVSKIDKFPELEQTEVYAPANGGIWYPRMYTLSDGSIICGFDTNEDGGSAAVKCVKSYDNGQTWDSQSVLISEFPDFDCANGQFTEYDGKLLCAYRCNRNEGDKYHSSIRVSESSDGGKSWKYQSTVIEYTGTGGVYEPHLGYIGGRLCVFYANDSHFAVEKDSQQNIECRFYDAENNNWDECNIVSDGRVTGSRDGMPVWDVLSDGTYILAIEATDEWTSGSHPFVVKILTSVDGIDWEDRGIVYSPEGTSKKAGAPYVVTLPDGRIAVSFQTDEDYEGTGDGNSCMKTIISKSVMTNDSEYSREAFGIAITPFNTPEGYCSAWNGMMVNGDYIFNYTSTSYPVGSVRLSKIKIK